MQEESIYNLIPKEYIQPPKQKLYRSRFHHSIAPTASTFGHHASSIPRVSNVSGNIEGAKKGYFHKSEGATFGKPRGSVPTDIKNFTKKGTGQIAGNYLPEIHDRGYRSVKTTRKASLPKRDDKPIFGLVSTKNYILANKVENMLAQPKMIEKKVDWVKKKDYGAVPKYLEKMKEQMLREYDYIRTLQQQEQEQHDNEKYILTEEEIKELREGLKTKWDFVNKKYQLLTHKAVLDTIGLRRRKEEYEKELIQIEKDMEKLNKGYIFIDSTQ